MVVYEVSTQASIPHPHRLHAHESTFFTLQKVRNALEGLQFGKAQHHEGFLDDHFIYGVDTFLTSCTYLSSSYVLRLLCSWTEHSIEPIFKQRSHDI